MALSRLLSIASRVVLGVACFGCTFASANTAVNAIDSATARVDSDAVHGVVTVEVIRVAVASNFFSTITKLVDDFEHQNNIKVEIVQGSTGMLAAQLRAGAPFDVLLAADEQHIQLLAKQGQIVPASKQCYAQGRLVLASRSPSDRGRDLVGILNEDASRVIALANPRTAPYGQAARQLLSRFSSTDPWRQVVGHSVGQAYQYFDSGNAQLALVSMSQIQDADQHWEVPSDWYTPLSQWLGISEMTTQRHAAQAFADFVTSVESKATIDALGYRGCNG